jgi:hypothetical protein
VENLFREEQKKVKKRKKSGKATLSFALDDEGEGEGGAGSTSGSVTPNASVNTENQRKKFRKNPAVDTSFLPDRDREEAERRQREELRQQWLKRQEEMKKEEIEITYSYWDGSGHRKSVVVGLLFLRGGSPVVHLAHSARKAMILLPFWKSAGFNFLNFEGLTSTISCTLRLVNLYSACPVCLSSPPLAGGSHYTTCQYVVSALLRANSFLFVSITHFTTL